MKVAAVVLAAGASTRMGQPKQLLPYSSSTILGTVLDALLSTRVESVTVVLGYNTDQVRASIGDRPVRIVANLDPSRGMLSSVQAGVAAVTDADVYLIALGDQPQLDRGVVDTLVRAAEQSPRAIILPTYGGKRGHPLLLRACLRDAVLSLSLDLGLNSLMISHSEEVEEISVDAPEILEDIDTPQDYRRLRTLAADSIVAVRQP